MGQTYPLPITPAMVTPAFVRVITYHGGEGGDDVSQASANSTDSYAPRNQAQKAHALDVNMAQDITTPRGWIDPQEPYNNTKVPVVVTSLTPDTAVVGDPPVEVTIAGSGFSPYSIVETGGFPTPFVEYVSPTELIVTMHPEVALAGIVTVVVIDRSTADQGTFTFTAAP